MKKWFKLVALLVMGLCLLSSNSWALKAWPSENQILDSISIALKSAPGMDSLLGVKPAMVPSNMDIICKDKDILFDSFKWLVGNDCSVDVKIRFPFVCKGGIPGHQMARSYYDPAKFYQYYLESTRKLFLSKAGEKYVIIKVEAVTDPQVVSGPNKKKSKGPTWDEKFNPSR